MEELRRRLDKHEEEDEAHFEKIGDALEVIKNNHLAHIQESIQGVEISFEKLSKDVEWMKFIFATITIALFYMVLVK